MENTSIRLKHLMELRGWRQRDMLELLNPVCDSLGMRRVSRSHMSRYVSGDFLPKQDKLYAMGIAFGVSPAWLMGVDVPMVNESEDLGLIPITTKKIPLLGDIACGEPIFADEDLSTTIEVDSACRADFALRCKGDSMTGDGINDGYIVFVHKQDYVDNGAIAVCLLDDEATLKHVWRRPDGSIELVASNPRYKPIRVEEGTAFRILGKAVRVQFDLL